ncbi:hypothetical protein BJX65DRAFT_134577 [Aspergillus insuetus]
MNIFIYIVNSTNGLADPEPSDQDDIDNISDWEDELCNYERGYIPRPIVDKERFHRLFISWGHAAREHMPRITLMKFDMDHAEPIQFEFVVGDDSTTLQWASEFEYRPDHRVANVWGFDLDRLSISGSDDERCYVVLPR